MSWLLDSRWLLALDKSTRLAAAVALGCGTVLGLVKLELIDFGTRTAEVRAALVVGGVFATAFVIVAIVFPTTSATVPRQPA